jgi:hypothetical protein
VRNEQDRNAVVPGKYLALFTMAENIAAEYAETPLIDAETFKVFVAFFPRQSAFPAIFRGKKE